MWFLLSTLLLSSAALCFSEDTVGERKTYDGYQVIEIIPQTVEQVKFLRDLMLSSESLDFWTEPSNVGGVVTIMASPLEFIKLQVKLLKENIKYVRTIENVKNIIEPMWQEIDERKAKNAAFNLNDFNTLSDIYGWLLETARRCTNGLNCQVYSIGNSHNGNPIQIFRMSRTGTNRKAYWIDATIHAREWIAPATILQVINALVGGTSSAAQRLTQDFDWYIMPVMNPDGYHYTWTNERLWRKNRRPNAGSTCIGTDLNRNFNFRWGTEGVSHNPCSETYCGASGGSEPETRAVQNELIRLGPTLLAAVTVHSYGNMWMFPWGNTVGHQGRVCERASDHSELMRVADLTANAIQATYNTRWSRGNSCEVIYTTTGGTDDYAKGVAGIKYAFCPELRGNSFVIPAAQIVNSFTEFFNGVVAMTNAIPRT